MGHSAIKHSCCILQLYIHKQLTIHLFFLRVEFKKNYLAILFLDGDGASLLQAR